MLEALVHFLTCAAVDVSLTLLLALAASNGLILLLHQQEQIDHFSIEAFLSTCDQDGFHETSLRKDILLPVVHLVGEEQVVSQLRVIQYV